MDDLKKLKLQKAAKIMRNPVLWAKAFLRTVDNKTKKIIPWTARWYQAEMLLDPSDKKVARCGRRTGKAGRMFLPFPRKLQENRRGPAICSEASA